MRLTTVTMAPTIYQFSLPFLQLLIVIYTTFQDHLPIHRSLRSQRRSRHTLPPAFPANFNIFTSYQLHNVNGWTRSFLLLSIINRTATWARGISLSLASVLRSFPAAPGDFVIFPALVYSSAWICTITYTLFVLPFRFCRFILFLTYWPLHTLLTLEPFWKFKTAAMVIYTDQDILPASVWERFRHMFDFDVRRWMAPAFPPSITLPVRQRGRCRLKDTSVRTTAKPLPRSFMKRLLLGLFTFWLLPPVQAINDRVNFEAHAYTSTIASEEDYRDSIARCYRATTGSRGRLIDFTSGNSQTVYLDNCANTHISNCKDDYITYTDLSGSSEREGVGNVGGTAKPEGIGTVRWKWEDDLGKEHVFELKECRYFPTSPANILSVSSLGVQLGDDDDGTWIKSGPYTSTFTWKKGRHQRTIKHTPSRMPIMHINGSNSKLGIFYS